MKISIILSVLALQVLAVTSLPAQNSNCYIKKTYPAGYETTLKIANKYGDVNFIATRSDSISVCVTITIEQKDNELAKKSKSLIITSIEKSSDTISVSTNFDKRFFSGTYSKGRKSFSVDILIKAPSFINIYVVNEFGNIRVDELSGIFNTRLSYGVIRATKLTRGNRNPMSSISVDNGKIDIDDVNWMSANIHNCPSVEIGRAQALLIKSDFSKIRIKSAGSMVADSKSDIYIIDSLKNIISESAYTSMKIGNLYGKMFSKATLGTMVITELKKGFSSLDITSVNAPVIIGTGDGVSFRYDITAENAPVEFLMKNHTGINKQTKNNSILYTGRAGDDAETQSSIRISSTSGNVTIK